MAEVTREDRLIALRLRFGTVDADPDGLYRQWAEDGKHLLASAYPTSSFADAIARMETMAGAVAAGRTTEREAAKAFLSTLELRAHHADERAVEAALYDARLRISGGEHAGSAEQSSHERPDTDIEIEALRTVHDALVRLSQRARRRVVEWAEERIRSDESKAAQCETAAKENGDG